MGKSAGSVIVAMAEDEEVEKERARTDGRAIGPSARPARATNGGRAGRRSSCVVVCRRWSSWVVVGRRPLATLSSANATPARFCCATASQRSTPAPRARALRFRQWPLALTGASPRSGPWRGPRRRRAWPPSARGGPPAGSPRGTPWPRRGRSSPRCGRPRASRRRR